MTIAALSRVCEETAPRKTGENTKTPRWRCWFGGSQPPRWRWKFGGRNNSSGTWWNWVPVAIILSRLSFSSSNWRELRNGLIVAHHRSWKSYKALASGRLWPLATLCPWTCWGLCRQAQTPIIAPCLQWSAVLPPIGSYFYHCMYRPSLIKPRFSCSNDYGPCLGLCG